MFMSLVLGVLAGLGVPFVVGPLSEAAKSKFELNERDAGIASFGVVLLIAALLGAILTSGASAFWLVLGGLLGAFGMRLFTMAKDQADKVSAAKKSLAEDAAEDASDKVDEVMNSVEDAAKDVKDTVTNKD